MEKNGRLPQIGPSLEQYPWEGLKDRLQWSNQFWGTVKPLCDEYGVTEFQPEASATLEGNSRNPHPSIRPIPPSTPE